MLPLWVRKCRNDRRKLANISQISGLVVTSILHHPQILESGSVSSTDVLKDWHKKTHKYLAASATCFRNVSCRLARGVFDARYLLKIFVLNFLLRSDVWAERSFVYRDVNDVDRNLHE